jgi:toxin CptA
MRPRPSAMLTLFVLTTHGAALAVAIAIPLDWYWRSGLVVAVLASLVYEMVAKVLFLAPWAVREATWKSDGAWILTLVSGEQTEARLLPSTFVARGLVVLSFRSGRWRSRTLVLPPDALDADLLRRLRVRLRLLAAADEADT